MWGLRTLTHFVWPPPGVHLVEVLYDEVAVPRSPFRVGVTEGCDPTRVRAFGPGLEGGLVNKANHFTVETRYPPNFLAVTPMLWLPWSQRLVHPLCPLWVPQLPQLPIKGDQEQTSPVSLSAGPHGLLSCPQLPPTLLLHPPSLVPVELMGVSSRRGAGTGGLGLAIEGPSEAKMSCKDNKDGSCTVEYIPFTAGDYDVNITFGGRPIPGEQQAARAGCSGGRGRPAHWVGDWEEVVCRLPGAGWP